MVAVPACCAFTILPHCVRRQRRPRSHVKQRGTGVGAPSAARGTGRGFKSLCRRARACRLEPRGARRGGTRTLRGDPAATSPPLRRRLKKEPPPNMQTARSCANGTVLFYRRTHGAATAQRHGGPARRPGAPRSVSRCGRTHRRRKGRWWKGFRAVQCSWRKGGGSDAGAPWVHKFWRRGQEPRAGGSRMMGHVAVARVSCVAVLGSVCFRCGALFDSSGVPRLFGLEGRVEKSISSHRGERGRGVIKQQAAAYSPC